MKKGKRTLRILVVDDEPLILWGISKFLEKHAVVKTATTAEDALFEIGREQYDLCFLDMTLPGMTGLDAMRLISVRSPDTRVVIMTGSSSDEGSIGQIGHLGYAFIEKPFDLSPIRKVTGNAAASMRQGQP